MPAFQFSHLRKCAVSKSSIADPYSRGNLLYIIAGDPRKLRNK